MRCISGSRDNRLYRSTTEERRAHICQRGDYSQCIYIVITACCHSGCDSTEGNVGTDVQTYHSESTKDYVSVDGEFLTDEFVIFYDNA